MKKIQKLSKEIIEQIAAGQVVERPASIVKELVENSLDADARNISIRLEDGGKTKLVVSDDGHGIAEDQLRVAVEQHTTSKIFTLSDLQKINSFGFRGEALWSISKVAKVVLQSKVSSSYSGRSLTIKDGTVVETVPVGMQQGTIITVTELFSSYPARKKFLKSSQLEFQYVIEVINQLALAYPAVGFQVFNNDKLIIDYFPNEEIKDRLNSVFGTTSQQLFIPVLGEGSEYSISGYIGKPQAAAQLTLQQILIVNKRPVNFLPITKVIKNSFGTLLPKNVHPPFVITIETNPELFDINIHPRKERIAFSEQQLVLDLVSQVIATALKAANLSFSFYGDSDSYLLQDSGMDPLTASLLKEETQEWNVKNFFEDEPILQVKKLYLIAQTKNGLLLVDQHAAHERILYDQFSKAFSKKNFESIHLKNPVVIELSTYESEILESNIELFNTLGFSIKRTSKNQFKVYALPIILQNRDIKKYFIELIEDIRAELPLAGLDDQTHKTIAYISCRSAIKAGEVLTQLERKNLLEKLITTEGKYTCPHGRPVYILLDSKELAQLFHRIPASRKEK